jgi:prolyl 4-hydroxylase
MRREKIDSENENFIGCWKIENSKLFDQIINFFELNSQIQNRGYVSDRIDEQIKKTTDITIDPIDLKKKEYGIFNSYFEELFKCYEDYKKQWPFLKKTIETLDIPNFNIQRYNPGDHFSHIHCERDNSKNMHRVFAWMTYLNDIKAENGTTNFTHYNIKIQPEQGKTLIWPAEWTHAHAGEILKLETKYIITGWMCFPLN